MVARRKRASASENLQREVERLRHERDELRRDREQVERDTERLCEENARLERERDRLLREIERLTQALEGEAAPFSKGAPTPHPRTAGRRPGRQHGRHAHRQPPAQINETVDVPLPSQCPHCGGQVEEMRVASQVQEDLPVVGPHVRLFTVHVGAGRACGRRLPGRHPLQTSDALGAASTHLRPQAVTLMVPLNKHLGLSHGKITTLLQEWFGLTVRPSAVTHALHRAARQAAPTYAALREQVRGSPAVSPDETSWKVSGYLQWLWAFATPTAVLYAIQPGRGFPQAAAVLGAEYAGVLVRDGWAPYRHFTHAAHQTCVAHLVRRGRDLTADHPRAVWPRQVHHVLQQALRVRDRRDAGEMSMHGAAVARGRLFHQLADLLEAPVRLAALQRFAAHLAVELPAVFAFLFDPTLDATNWRAEQALRPAAVVNRKVSGGNRSPRGADAPQILASVIHTARLRYSDTRAVLTELLHARQPIPSRLLTLPQ